MIITIAFPLTVTPSEPTIKVNGRDLNELRDSITKSSEDNSTIGPFAESSTMVLECTTSGGRPVPEVRWYNGSRVLRSKVTTNPIENSATATLRFIVSRHDLGARFECRVLNNATRAPLVAGLSLDIHGELRSRNSRNVRKGPPALPALIKVRGSSSRSRTCLLHERGGPRSATCFPSSLPDVLKNTVRGSSECALQSKNMFASYCSICTYRSAPSNSSSFDTGPRVLRRSVCPTVERTVLRERKTRLAQFSASRGAHCVSSSCS